VLCFNKFEHGDRLMRSRDLFCCGIIVSLILMSGCGGDRPSVVPVSGKVLIDDKPLTFGTVVFSPKNGRQSTGVINKDGTFSLTCYKLNDGAIIGDHKISVSATESLNADTALKWYTPPKYSEASKSGLTQEIKGANDSVIIRLTWKGNIPSEPFVEQLGTDAEAGMRAKMKRSSKTGS
jgi:hypothetical protein